MDSSFNPSVQVLFRRLAAFLIDLAICSIPTFLLLLVSLVVFPAHTGMPFIFLGPTFLFYSAVMNSDLFDGQTFGKQITKIQTVDSHGSPISLGQSFLRSCIQACPLLLIALFIQTKDLENQYLPALLTATFITIEFYFLIFNRRTRQGLHDIVAQTFVVRARVTNLHFFPPIWRGHYAIIAICGLLQVFWSWSGYRIGVSDHQFSQRDPASVPVESKSELFAPKLLNAQKERDPRNPNPRFRLQWQK